MKSEIRSRYAPTPSGFLHLGNAYNFLLTQKLVKEKQGEIFLRIDDLDATRTRDEYLIDIFECLDWLKLKYDTGPKDLKDFKSSYSQNLRTTHYHDQMAKLDGLFTCICTRSEIKNLSPKGIYPGTCRGEQLRFIKDENCIRYTYDSEDNLKDFVIWRKEDLPSYQLVSTVEDIEHSINFVVRGIDLIGSSIVQKHLINQFSPDHKITFLHHPLITENDGTKLSKSEGAYSLKAMRAKDSSPNQILDGFEKWYETIKDSIRES